MQVVSIRYVDTSEAWVETSFADGRVVCGPYPSNDGPTRSAQEAFIAGGGSVTAYITAPPTAADVAAERTRRLALGFNYDFGDARGVHHIGTTKADLEGWDEVSTYAGALIDSGDVETQIAIMTNTGPCLVTAPEWRAIEIAAAQFRQPLWAKSFALQAMTPIPGDYTNDAYWT